MRRLLGLAVIAALAVAGCSGDDDDDTSPPTGGASTTAAGTPSTADQSDFVSVRGNLTLDGEVLDAEFLGAVVVRDELVTPCQGEIPKVVSGAYDIAVLTDAASAGCGAPGARIVLWTFVNDTRLYATTAIPWPASSRDTTFDASFSTDTPFGITSETADFTGLVYGADGNPVATGTRVEAFVGDTLCAVAGVRDTGEYTGYILAVVGDDAVPGCTRGADLTFTIDGEPATETVPNEPGRRDALDLHVAS
jgi:hypothetical protein